MVDQKPTFENIESFSSIVENNEFFVHYSNPDILEITKSNYIVLKYSPSLEEFKLIETILLDFQKSYNQTFLKFKWPENTGIHIDVLEYLNQSGYHLGRTLLMTADPKNISVNVNNEVKIKKVESSTKHLFFDINHQEDLKISRKQADTSNKYYRYQLQFDYVKARLASLNDHIVGSVIIISNEKFLEVDNLLTVAEYRKLGVASTLMNHVKDLALKENKSIILSADAEDFPKDIYQKMGFNILSSQIEAQRTW